MGDYYHRYKKESEESKIEYDLNWLRDEIKYLTHREIGIIIREYERKVLMGDIPVCEYNKFMEVLGDF